MITGEVQAMNTTAPTLENPVHAAVYVRVSSEEQAKDNYSIPMQREACLDALDRRFGKDLYVPVFFADEGVPGTLGLYDPNNPRRKHRPALQRMYEAFKAGEVTVLCVYRLSRLWRNAACGEFLQNHFVAHGLTEVVSCHDRVDLNSASGRLNLNVTSAMSAFEVGQLAEWIRDAKQKRKRDGYANGIPFGWRKQRDEERDASGRPGIAPDEENAAHVRGMAEMYVAGDSIRSITAMLNTLKVPTKRRTGQWATSVVRNILANPTHAGLLEVELEDGSRELRPGKHYDQRIYDPEVYQQIRARLDRNRRLGGRQASRPEFLLAGLVTCANCGGRLHGATKRSHVRLYRCRDGMQSAIEGCTRSTADAVTLEGMVIDEIRHLSSSSGTQSAAALEASSLVVARAAAVDEEIQQLEGTIRRLWADYDFWSDEFKDSRCDRDEFERHRERFRDGKANAQRRLDELAAIRMDTETRRQAAARASELVSDFDACWGGLSPEERRELVHTVIARASLTVLDGGSKELRFALHGYPEVVRIIHASKNPERPQSGLESLWPTEQAALYWVGQGLDVHEIARKRGIHVDGVRVALHDARAKLGADTNEVAWRIAREYIEANLHSLPLTRRKRKKAPPKDLPLLTEAQTGLLSLLAQGMTVAAAAQALDISANTAYVHLKNCRDRLGCASNEEAVRKARDIGLIG